MSKIWRNKDSVQGCHIGWPPTLDPDHHSWAGSGPCSEWGQGAVEVNAAITCPLLSSRIPSGALYFRFQQQPPPLLTLPLKSWPVQKPRGPGSTSLWTVYVWNPWSIRIRMRAVFNLDCPNACLWLCVLSVAANLQKIVEEPQANRSVTFRLVFIPAPLLSKLLFTCIHI